MKRINLSLPEASQELAALMSKIEADNTRFLPESTLPAGRSMLKCSPNSGSRFASRSLLDQPTLEEAPDPSLFAWMGQATHQTLRELRDLLALHKSFHNLS